MLFSHDILVFQRQQELEQILGNFCFILFTQCVWGGDICYSFQVGSEDSLPVFSFYHEGPRIKLHSSGLVASAITH